MQWKFIIMRLNTISSCFESVCRENYWFFKKIFFGIFRLYFSLTLSDFVDERWKYVYRGFSAWQIYLNRLHLTKFNFSSSRNFWSLINGPKIIFLVNILTFLKRSWNFTLESSNYETNSNCYIYLKLHVLHKFLSP